MILIHPRAVTKNYVTFMVKAFLSAYRIKNPKWKLALVDSASVENYTGKLVKDGRFQTTRDRAQ